MADLLIGVGGTGQHVALAVSRLVFIGALPELELAMIDADDGQELTRSLRTFGQTVEKGYTTHPLLNGSDIYSPFDKTDLENPTFADLLLSETAPKRQREIFDVCFDDESARIQVSEGMYGRPAIGAAIFAKNFAQPRAEQQLKPVFERADLADKNIYISGSMVGGTGAGLIHQLVNSLQSSGKFMYGLVFLNWLSIAPSERRQTISDGTLQRNMKYGLSYLFDKTRNQLKATLLIGPPKEPPADNLKPIRVMAGDTQEKPHLFHLLAAYGILQLPRIAVTETTDGAIYAASQDTDAPAQVYKAIWGDKPLHWYISRAMFVKKILDYVSTQGFRREINSAFGLMGKPQNVGRGLYDVINSYGKNQRSIVIDEIVKTWEILARQYTFSITWVEQLLEPLPLQLQDARYTGLRADADVATEIQTVWRRSPELGQEQEEPAKFGVNVAHIFHRMLVDSFQ